MVNVLEYITTMLELELRKIKNDRTELYTRAIQPILWLVLYGTVIGRIRAIPTGGIPYIDYITPAIIIQSSTFISIFYGLTLVWERESGILKKLITTPLPRYSIVVGRSLASGIRSLFQIIIITTIALLLGVKFYNVFYFLIASLIIFFMSSGFASLSVVIASFMKTRERFMGIGQAITMPLFFASSGLYPIELMPKVLQYIALGNPLTYIIDICRRLMITGNMDSIVGDVLAILIFNITMYILASIRFKKIIE
ncbi:ABC transporter permease [Saccharolobus solfataricus]|uniref:Multidrug ABC transporter permease n=1 Tax=Saccharolobus solfataricus TaxID=2287 RepID=A0A157T739_SACSO|nr:ABC transporter permease [Saccharolobus solfataricus]SAI86721.1 multidrug ABC transporter permease [Saccharolobus solfataricus]